MAEGERAKCLCGCGGTPVRGDFLPGDDAKFYALFRRWKAGDYDARLNRVQLEYLQKVGRVKAEIRYT